MSEKPTANYAANETPGPPTRPSGCSKSAIAAALRLLAEVFGREISAPAMAAMLDALGDLDLARLRQACGAAMRDCASMPSVATLRRLAGVPTADQAASAEAEAAWERLLAHCAALNERERQAAHGDGWRLPDCPDCGGSGWISVSREGQSAVRRCACVARVAAERLQAIMPLAAAEARIVRQLGGIARFRRVVHEGAEEFGYLRRDFLAAWATAQAGSRARAAQDRRMLAAGDDGSEREEIAAPRAAREQQPGLLTLLPGIARVGSGSAGSKPKHEEI